MKYSFTNAKPVPFGKLSTEVLEKMYKLIKK